MNFDDLYNLLLEYRHDYADGSPAQSVQVKNTKDPNSVGPEKKNLGTIGPYKNVNPKVNVNASILSAQELAQMGIDFELNKTIKNNLITGLGLAAHSDYVKPNVTHKIIVTRNCQSR